MHRPNYCFLVLGLAACALAVTGCSGDDGRVMLDTEYVEGVVTLDGEPVPDATVTFVPVDTTQGMSATGRTDEQGVYKLTAVGSGEATGEAEAGTLPGEYQVGVIKTISDSLLTEEEAEEQGVEYVAPTRAEELAADVVTFVVPKKYNNPRQSELKVTVQEGDNEIPIELTSR